MATITLKNIPDAIHGALKERAKSRGRSLNKEILQCLEASVVAPRIEVENILAAVDRVRGDGVQLNPNLLEEALRSGRP